MDIYAKYPHWQLQQLPKVCVSAGLFSSVCMCACVWVELFVSLGWSHLGADGSGVGVEVRRPASMRLPQQGSSDGGQRHRQRLVLIVCRHVGDALSAVAHLIRGANVKGRVIG